MKRIWDLPRLVLDGMRPLIDDDWPQSIKNIISESWLHNAERRPDMEEAQAKLQVAYDDEKVGYEAKRKRKTDDDDGELDLKTGKAKPMTAHTGQLQQILDEAVEHPTPPGTNSSVNLARVDDLATSSNTDETAVSKKKKKKVKTAGQ